MNDHASRLLSLYSRALTLYPATLQAEYAEEMLDVFRLTLEENEGLTLAQSIRLAWRELRDLPGLLLSAHLREWRKTPMNTPLYRSFGTLPEGSWKEILLAALPFVLMALLPGVFTLIPAVRSLPNAIGISILIVMGLTLVVFGIIGLLVRLPRWSLVYAGVPLTVLPFGIAFLLIAPGTLPIPNGWSPSATVAALMALALAMTMLLLAGLVWLAGKFKLTRDFKQRVTADPSLFSLLLYGGALFLVLAGFEDVAGVNVYLLLAALCLIAGVWIFLRTERFERRVMALVIASTAAMILSVTANLTLVDYSAPMTQVVAFQAITWLAILGMLGLPVLIFPRREVQAGS